MKKKYKSIIIFILMLIFIATIPCKSHAGIFEQAKAFLEEGAKEVGMLEEDAQRRARKVELFGKLTGLNLTVRTGFEELIDTLWSIGLLTIFVCTIILGVKYMLVLPDERSRIKQATTPYIMGVVIIFGALTIWRLVIVVLDGSLN